MIPRRRFCEAAGLALFCMTLPVAAQQAPIVELTTSMGAVRIQLDPAKAPKSVENFLQYVKDGHYKGTIFHRVIPGFMVQGGGFTPDFKQKPTRGPIPNEAGNGLKNEVGTLAMARTPDPNSATAQFFINVARNEFLDHRAPTPQDFGYAVFGRVVAGMDVIEKIVRVQTGMGPPPHQNVPVKPIVIEDAKIVTGGK
jgi:cyclophilin family peptidyl-prolyl cis-trans isomerase